MSLLALLTTLAYGQAVVTDDANTSSFYPTKNFGSSIALIVCSGSHTYIKFSLANLGPVTGTNVSTATLILYTDFVLTSGTMDVYQVSGSWSEGKISYNNSPALGTKLFSAVSVTNPGYLSLDMTSTVQAWLNGTLANNGIALVPSTGSSISVSFDSKENVLTSHTAQLPLVLVSAGLAGQQGPQGVQGPQGMAGPQGPQGPQGSAGPAGPAGQQGIQGMMGLTGLTGATGPAGANGTGFNFRNGFDNSASYVANDVVTYKGSSYIATSASVGPSNPTPDTNTTAWTIMAAQGATGAAGAQGPTGSAGAAGGPGPAGAQGPAGPTGPTGPIGLTGPPGSGGGFSGIQEFTNTGTFTVPAGVTHVLIELWGGGGGGGGSGSPELLTNAYGQYYYCTAAGGGAGGAAGYTRAVLSVSPGATYTINVGAAGYANGSNGTAGGDTTITDTSQNILAKGGGGKGGTLGDDGYQVSGTFGPICNTPSAGVGGAGGTGGSGVNVVGRPGTAGGSGTVATSENVLYSSNLSEAMIYGTSTVTA
jgi:hypothetical protein